MSEHLHRLNAQADACLRTDPVRATRLATRAARLAFKANDMEALAIASRHLGNALVLRCEYAKALPPLRQGLEAARVARLPAIEGSCLNGMGIALMRLGDFQAALRHLLEFLRMSRALNIPRARTVALTNVGAIHEELQDYDEARRCFELALENSADTPDDACMARQNIAVLLAARCRFKSALPHYQLALEAIRRRRDPTLEAHLLANLGKCQYLAGERVIGVATLHEAMSLSQRVMAGAPLCLATMHLGQLLAHARRWEESLRTFDSALAMAERLGERYYQREIHRALAALHQRSQRHSLAMQHARAFNRLDAAIYRSRAEGRIEALRAQLQLEREQGHTETMRSRNHSLARSNRKLRAEKIALQRVARTTSAAGADEPVLVSDPLLSPREHQILGLMAQGMTNAAAAAELGLSVYTVRGHVSSILAKLGVARRTEAVAMALRGRPR